MTPAVHAWLNITGDDEDFLEGIRLPCRRRSDGLRGTLLSSFLTPHVRDVRELNWDINLFGLFR